MALVIGGSYYVGFVGEVQRGLNDPQAASQKVAGKIAEIEQTLGYQGYLGAYRSFRLTGDINARRQLAQRSMEAARALDGLKALFAAAPDAKLAIKDVEAVVEEFARVARSAPETANAALRGSASMEAVDSMPQLPQLESTYLTLRSGLDRLRAQASAYQMGSIAWALTWSQMLIICAFAAIVCGLLVAASLLQIGITQPLKLLARSLGAAGEGRLSHPIWGTDRADEIGDMARAGEKLRKSLTETDALRELAQKGELSIRIEGEASALLQRTVSEVVASVHEATSALQHAAAGLDETRDAQRNALAAQTTTIGNVSAKLEYMVAGFGESAGGAVDSATTSLRLATERFSSVAEARDAQLAAVASQLEDRGKNVSEAFDQVRARTAGAIDNLTGSITAFSRAAESTQAIQSALFSSCDRISSDASSTAENIRTLAGRLEDVVTMAETRLAPTQPPSPATTTDESQDEITAMLRLFQDNDAQDTSTGHATARDMLVERIASALRDRLTPDEALRRQVEAMRSDIRELALRMTEERILMTAEMPAPALAAETPVLSTSPRKTLADVPADEILERLRRLSDEMSAAPRATPGEAGDADDDLARQDHAGSLTDNLRAFAMSVRPLAASDDPAAIAQEFERHADAIEQSASEVAQAAALRAELDAITAELRNLAGDLQASAGNPAEHLQEAALDLGARAETLFSYLQQRQATATDDGTSASSGVTTGTETMSRATNDLLALARIIGSLEQRTALLSDAAVAANISHQTRNNQPSAEVTDMIATDDTDEAIAVVYEAVERLNNIAAALARASDASRQRAAAGA